MLITLLGVFALFGQEPAQQSQQQPPPRPEDLASIEGKVINKLTREPVKFAEVTLRTGDFAPETIKATSEGTFSVNQLRPGRYHLEARKNGFTTPRRKPGQVAEVVILEKGSRKTGQTIELLPQAAVAGRVTDENGEPVAGAMVNAELARAAAMPGNMRNVQTNDRGEYRLFGLEPGRFRIRVTPPQTFAFDQASRNTKPARIRPEGAVPAEGPVPVYFPAATSPEQAGIVELAAGDERQGIDIQMVKARVFEVSGRVIPPASWIAENSGRQIMIMGNVTLLSTRRGQMMNMGGSGGIDASGRFALKTVAPGSYILMANLINTRTQGRVKIDVLQGDVTNLEVPFHPPVTLTGTLKTPDKMDASKFRILLQSADTLGNLAQTGVDAKGAFKLENVLPELMSLRVASSEAPTYVQSVRLDGQDQDVDAIAIRPGEGGQLEVTIANDGGVVEGMVRTAGDGEHEGAMIALWPNVEPGTAIKPSLFRLTRSGPKGKFQMQGIRPGKYLIAAFDNLMPMGPSGVPDEETLRSACSKAQTVVVDAGSKIAQDLKSLGDPE